MRVRQGYREWALNLDLAASVGVHTIVPFDGVLEDGTGNRLFAVTNEAIWDVTVAGDAPVNKFTFSDQTPSAGYGVYTHYVDGSGTDLLYYADSRNGLFEYDPVGDVWAQATGISGPVITNVNFIVSHKQRLWMCEEGEQSGWYLPVGSNSGQATEFFFASKFKHGGALVGLFNWSVDGGDGVDDYLVAVSRSGDVLPFRGDDPSSADTWSLVGTYFIGKVPIGPSFGTEQGGELYLLSSFGIVSMNDLLKGVGSAYSENTLGGDLTSKIASWIRSRLKRTVDQFGWAIRVVPGDGSVVINAVPEATYPQLQFVYNITTNAWGQWRGVPMLAFDSYQGYVVFGDADSRVLYMDTNTDNNLLTPPIDKPNGDAIKFSVLTSYSGLERDGVFKRVKLIRADFVAKNRPEFVCQARYDYSLEESESNTTAVARTGEWDSDLWDSGAWSTDSFSGFNGINGTWGHGRYVAVAMAGESRTDTRFAGWDVIFDIGGVMV